MIDPSRFEAEIRTAADLVNENLALSSDNVRALAELSAALGGGSWLAQTLVRAFVLGLVDSGR